MDLTRFVNSCKKNGLHVTYQRLSVYKALINHFSHPTAEMIYQQIKKEQPTISLATVYKTLETLAKYGLISKVTELHDAVRYDGNKRIHHHVVCVKCKKITDIESEQLNNLKVPENTNKEFKILGYRVQFDALCKRCQQGSNG